MVGWLQKMIGLSPDEARYVWALLGIVACVLTILGTGTSVLAYRWGRLRERRDLRRQIDRVRTIEVDLVFGPVSDSGANFSAVTVGGFLPLHDVFLDERIEAAIRSAVGRRRKIGEDFLFLPEGAIRHRAYEIVGAHITGNERIGNQAALFGRHHDCAAEMVAFMLHGGVAEDGREMAQMIKCDPAQLELIHAGKLKRAAILPLRGAHVPYRSLAEIMAAKFAKSKELFAGVNAVRGKVSEEEWIKLEREAGEKAEVWLALVRATRVGVSAHQVRQIMQEELTAALERLLSKKS